MTTTHTPISESTCYVNPVCKRRTELLNRLAVTLERLGEAALQLKTWLDRGDAFRELSLRGEVAKLRGESDAIRFELRAHRASHGC